MKKLTPWRLVSKRSWFDLKIRPCTVPSPSLPPLLHKSGSDVRESQSLVPSGHIYTGQGAEWRPMQQSQDDQTIPELSTPQPASWRLCVWLWPCSCSPSAASTPCVSDPSPSPAVFACSPLANWLLSVSSSSQRQQWISARHPEAVASSSIRRIYHDALCLMWPRLTASVKTRLSCKSVLTCSLSEWALMYSWWEPHWLFQQTTHQLGTRKFTFKQEETHDWSEIAHFFFCSVKTVRGKQLCYSHTSQWAQGLFNQFHSTEGSGLRAWTHVV